MIVAELISVILATYNRADALDAVLRALARQTDRGFEVFVADDGSSAATRLVVESHISRIGVPLKHVWHEDRGFRLAEIRNRAIRACAGVNCVFLDGDCIPRPGFIAAHRRLAESGWFVAGNRALLSRALTEKILRDGLQPELWGVGAFIAARLRGEINRLAPIFSLPLGPLRKRLASQWQGARGSNLAIRKSDLLRVDGFDAAFSGWGLEDSDIIVRLIRSGTRRKDGRFATGVLHLWHPEADRSRLAENQRRLEEIIGADRVRAIKGMSTSNENEGKSDSAPVTARDPKPAASAAVKDS
ncbi:MAG: glycosyltransferase family 2 protein [Rhizobiales bacterium]|nr:glycosyltransferase family 2 protein [Hyphomicrobiales bacterium]